MSRDIDDLTKEEMERINATFKAINTIRKGLKRGTEKGFMECPYCKGMLRFTVSSYNGHIWGKCETPDCLDWIE